MEYTIERLLKSICEYEFCKCIELYKDADAPYSDDVYSWIWEELKDGIDEDFIPVLTELNEKGYHTSSCCSGHLEQIEKYGTWNIYLSFENDYDLAGIPLDRRKNYLTYCSEYKGNKKATVQEKNEDRLRVLNELLKWAKTLPEIKDDYYRIEDGYVMAGNEKLYKTKVA